MGVDPITIGMAAMSAVSSLAGSQAQKQQANYQAHVAQQNAALARQNANYAARAGAQKEQSEAYKVRGLLGQQMAAQAASGLDVNAGSPVLVRDSTAALGRLGFANIRDNAAREMYGNLAQATNFSNQAALDKASAPTLFSSLLGAASAAGKTYAGMGGANPFTGGGSGTAAGLGLAGIKGSYASYPRPGGMKASAINLVR